MPHGRERHKPTLDERGIDRPLLLRERGRPVNNPLANLPDAPPNRDEPRDLWLTT